MGELEGMEAVETCEHDILNERKSVFDKKL